MNNMAKVLLLVLMSSFSSAFADDTALSEFQHMASGGKFEFTPSLEVGSYVQKYDLTYSNGVDKTTDHYYLYGVRAEYGFSDMISAGFLLRYASHNIAYPSGAANRTANGLVNPDIYVNAKNAIGPGTLRYGAHFLWSMSKHYIDSQGDSNADSGGSTLNLFAGYELPIMSSMVVGLQAAYDIWQDDRQFHNETFPSFLQDNKVKNGGWWNLRAFFEYTMDPVLYGIELNYVNHAQSKINFASGALPDTDVHDNGSAIAADLYGNWKIAKDTSLLPTIGFDTTDHNIGYLPGVVGANSGVGMFVNVAGRFGF